MLGRILIFITLGLATTLAPASAQARRLALVIGNDAYRNNAPLSMAVNDARAVAEAVTKLGFDAVSGGNLSHDDMAAKISQFIATLAAGDTACVFFLPASDLTAAAKPTYWLSMRRRSAPITAWLSRAPQLCSTACWIEYCGVAPSRRSS